jgi:hypothetical protein
MLYENDQYKQNLTHGAKNLIKTDFPAVSVSKLSGVRLFTLADTAEIRVRKVATESFIVRCMMLRFMKL